jgi:hypothetical protein
MENSQKPQQLLRFSSFKAEPSLANRYDQTRLTPVIKSSNYLGDSQKNDLKRHFDMNKTMDGDSKLPVFLWYF